MPLYGHELDREITPLEAGLDRYVIFDKPAFIGRDALLNQKEAGPPRLLAELVMMERGIPRAHYPIQRGGQVIGWVTSGGYAPTLQKNLGLCLIGRQFDEPGTPVEIIIRNKPVKAQIAKGVFYKRIKQEGSRKFKYSQQVKVQALNQMRFQFSRVYIQEENLMEPLEVVEGLYYSEDHEWVRIEGDRAYIGLTAYAAHHLGDIVFVELPEVDAELQAGDIIGAIESVKAVSDMHTPVSGVIVDVNKELENAPESLNKDQHIAVLKVTDPCDLDRLMTSDKYAAFSAAEE
jgi:glycine cleavage system H protein